MKKNTKDSRRFCGHFMPNIYFLLQVVTILLLVLIYLQVADVFSFGTDKLYIIFLIATGSVVFFAIKRSNVIRRQNHHCKEEEY